MVFALEHFYSTTIVDHHNILATLRQRDPEEVELVTRRKLEETAANLTVFLKETE